MGLVYSQDAFRQICTLNLLKEKIGNQASIKNILIIGDGYGILSGLLHDAYPSARIFLIDLGLMLFFQSYYLNNLFPEADQFLIGAEDNPNGGGVFNFCSAENISLIHELEIDLAINIASMQEMAYPIVNNYFTLLRKCKTHYFYCCNRVEKEMPGGEISRFMSYPWTKEDKHLIDELCPWHKWFLGYGNTPNLKYGIIPIPFFHLYDGPHWHRFSILSNDNFKS